MTQATDDSDHLDIITLPHPPNATWKPWELMDLGSEFHLVPSQDKMPHLNTNNCSCEPIHKANIKSLDGNRYPFYLHRSYDLREIDQWWYNQISGADQAVIERL